MSEIPTHNVDFTTYVLHSRERDKLRIALWNFTNNCCTHTKIHTKKQTHAMHRHTKSTTPAHNTACVLYLCIIFSHSARVVHIAPIEWYFLIGVARKLPAQSVRVTARPSTRARIAPSVMEPTPIGAAGRVGHHPFSQLTPSCAHPQTHPATSRVITCRTRHARRNPPVLRIAICCVFPIRHTQHRAPQRQQHHAHWRQLRHASSCLLGCLFVCSFVWISCCCCWSLDAWSFEFVLKRKLKLKQRLQRILFL